MVKLTRNEYRLTRFGQGFPYLKNDSVGNLLILCKKNSNYYKGFVLESDKDIEDFLAAYNLSPEDTNSLLSKSSIDNIEDRLLRCFNKYINELLVEYPSTKELSNQARQCFFEAFQSNAHRVIQKPDETILSWIDIEFKLYKVLENFRLKDIIKKPFETVDELIKTANSILNRRKSRAGASLENQLSELFKLNELSFDEQVNTEANKKPDFIFPSSKCYHDSKFKTEKLTFLAAKTTCKDRWRQILNEADRIKEKHLFTLQKGISSNQINEMKKNNVILVVPQSNKNFFPPLFRNDILTLKDFIFFVKNKQIL
jgi:hypothetical protein